MTRSYVQNLTLIVTENLKETFFRRMIIFTYWSRWTRIITITLFIYFGTSHLYPTLKSPSFSYQFILAGLTEPRPRLWVSKTHQFCVKMVARWKIEINKLEIHTATHFQTKNRYFSYFERSTMTLHSRNRSITFWIRSDYQNKL